MNTSSLIQKVWNFCHTLRDDGVGYGEQIVATLSRHLSCSRFRELLPPREAFEQKIHSALQAARDRLGHDTSK